jgi:hypothetical protein
MKVESYLVSQAIHFIVPEGPEEFSSPIPAIRAIQDKYGFVQVPHTVEELDLKKGVNFLRGFFRGQVVEKLAIFENGLLCESRCDNSILDDFLTEFLQWANAQRFRGSPARLTGLRAYLSQMEVISNVKFERTFSKLNAFGDKVTGFLASYGQPASKYSVHGFRMHYDVTENTLLGAPEFIFERRAGSPFSSNKFFTSAPIKTAEHLELLESLETLLS